TDLGEFFKHSRIMTGNDQAGRSGQLFHAVLGTKVGSGIKGLGDGRVLFQVLVEIHVVTGKNHRARLCVNAYELRLQRVLASGVAGDAGKNFLGVAVHQAYAAGKVELDHGKHVIRFNAAVRARVLPSFSGVIRVLILLQPDASARKQVHSVSVVPV